MPKKPNPKRVCIFYRDGCGRCTKEDVWPTWVSKYIPRDIENYTAGFTKVFPHHKEETKEKIDGDPRSRRVRFVCGKCNSGWMSVLQNTAKPILLPLIMGEKIVLSQSAQRIVAAWCAMSIMTADFFYPERQAIPQVQRDWLRDKGEPPPDTWKIWIANYQRVEWVNHCARNLIPVLAGKEDIPEFSADGIPRPNTQTTSFVVGKLYIHAYSSVLPNMVEKIGISPPLSEAICQIWPVREHFVAWPTTPITDRQADDLAGVIANVIDTLGRPDTDG
jgi:hypothetical protein